jgi:hypothetical protein
MGAPGQASLAQSERYRTIEAMAARKLTPCCRAGALTRIFGLAAWCASCGPTPPTLLASLPGGTIPLHVKVVNHSTELAAADLDIYIDEIHVLTGVFAQGTPFWADTTISLGPHAMRAESVHGRVSTAVTFTVYGESWSVLDFYYQKVDGNLWRQLSWFITPVLPSDWEDTPTS